MNIQCIKCKGRLLCGRKFCPIIAKSEAMFKVKDKLSSEDFQGSAPTPFVGHYGYPYLNVGILSIPEIKPDAWLYDAPRHWALNNFEIPRIIDFRSELINSRFKAHAHDRNKLIELSQEVGLASKPVDVEVNLEKKPAFRLTTDSHSAPMGPSAQLKNVSITSNPDIHTKVDKVFSDTDLHASDAIIYLYENEFDENFLSRILSIGTLGLRQSRKLVPTKWAITSVDSNIGDYLIPKVKEYNKTSFTAYFGGYLGNYYLIFCFPEVYSYELFETYMPKSSWNVDTEIHYTTDYEPYYGRNTYAENCAGGFYASRLSVLEKLDKIKKQASVLCLRFITGEYAVPLGVWVCRESTRKALGNKPIEFSNCDLMLNYAQMLVKKKFNFDLTKIIENSIIIKNIKQQSKLSQFFSSTF